MFWPRRLITSTQTARHGGPAAAIGKTVVSSGLIDRVAARLGRRLVEVPVGFNGSQKACWPEHWASPERKAAEQASCGRDGTAWTTDKDGLIVGLLAAEITACTGTNPAAAYGRITHELGQSWYERIDEPATASERTQLKALTPAAIDMTELAGAPAVATITSAAGNGAPIGGIKVVAENGWFAARPSGTEDIYKIYAESFRSEVHLRKVQQEAQDALARVFRQHSPVRVAV